jgi:hypothetical protein
MKYILGLNPMIQTPVCAIFLIIVNIRKYLCRAPYALQRLDLNKMESEVANGLGSSLPDPSPFERQRDALVLQISQVRESLTPISLTRL